MVDIVEQLNEVVRAGTPDDVSKRDYGTLLHLTATTIGRAIEQPRAEGRELLLEMIVARPAADNAASISLRNLRQANPLNPRFIKDAFTAGGAAATAAFAGAAHFFAFIAAVSVFAARSVPRSEAMTLHLAWKIARADGCFTLSDVMQHVDELRDNYEVDKVSEADIISYLNALARAGSLRSTPRGYALVERIIIIPL